MENKKRIALVIKTDGLEYDDRVRKEVLTTQKLFPDIEFKVFVMFPENKETDGMTGYGVPYHSVFIPSRDKYPSSKKAALKSYEFYRAIKSDLKGYDAVWCANEDTAMVVALIGQKNLLWDLHELPTSFLGSTLKRMLLKYLFSRCKVVVHANPQRAMYLHEIGIIANMKKHLALRNYPNFDDEEKETDDTLKAFVEWKNNRKCVYLQGLLNDSRAAYESIKSILMFPSLCCVVVGKYDQESKERLDAEFGDSLNERVRFIGKIAQLRIPHYVKQCFMTMVFYKNVRPNNYYCEANRFYQSVIMGLPVVVGNNPPMKEIVDKYGFGVSIDDDGRNINKIVEGIQCVMDNYETYVRNNQINRHFLLWDSQEAVFKQIIQGLL